MQKLMGNNGLSDWTAFWGALSHMKKFIVALSVVAKQPCQKLMVVPKEETQYGIKSPQEGHFKYFTYSRDALLLFISCV